MTRANAILLRWGDLALCGIVAAVVWYFAAPFLDSLIQPSVDRIATVPEWCVYLVFLLMLVAYVVRHPKRFLAFFGFNRYCLAYPPLWIAVFFAGLSVHWLDSNQLNSYQLIWPDLTRLSHYVAGAPHVGLFAHITYGLVLVVVSIVILKNDDKRDRYPSLLQNATNVVLSSPDLWSFDQIREWLSNDDEIKDPSKDYFGHNAIARRIALRLCKNDGTERPTIAFVGEKGSGKSTIAELVKYHLNGHPDIRIVRRSVWPYQSSEAAVRGILDSLIDELSHHVNVLSLRGLPEQYVAAIERTKGSWSALAALTRPSADPEKIVERVANIARAVNLHLVLWIEDLERFSGSTDPTSDLAQNRETERLGPIRALLYLLDRAPQISVIVCDTSLNSRFDLDKIARFIERPPRIDVLGAWNPVSAIRGKCLNGYPTWFIAPADPKLREELKMPDPTILGFMRYMRADRAPTFPEAFTRLLSTPRALKASLRLTLEVWEPLCGEIDFDDVLAMNVLRIAKPNFFSFIDENVADFRQGLRQSEHSRTKAPHPVHKALTNLLNVEQDDTIRSAIESIICFVFRSVSFEEYGGVQHDPDRLHLDRPQALAVDRHVEYWRRYTASISVPQGESDQAVLQSIRDWRAGVPNDLLERLLDARSDQVETFANQFSRGELCRLLADLLPHIRTQPDEQRGELPYPPALMSIRRMMKDCRPAGADLIKTLTPWFQSLPKLDLLLLFALHDMFVKPQPPFSPLLENEEQEVLCALTWNALPRTGSQLLGALHGGPPDRLLQICGRLRLLPWLLTSKDEDRWSPLANIILDACDVNPSGALPYLLPFVTKITDKLEVQHGEVGPFPMHTHEAQFVADHAEKLFDIPRLTVVLSKAERSTSWDTGTHLRFDAAHSAARLILENEASNAEPQEIVKPTAAI